VLPLRDDNPTERFPIVTYTLVLLNLLAFAWQLGLPAALSSPHLLDAMLLHLEDSVRRGAVVPLEILTFSDVDLRNIVPPPFTIFTSMFLHGGIGHILANLLSLWIFGNNVEDALGRLRFLAFYLGAGIVAALAQVLASAVAGEVYVQMVGASGAISGVLAAYMLLFPRARVLTLVVVFILPVPAVLFIGFWFFWQVRSVVFGGQPGVAVFAHIGGFVAGYLLVRIVGRRRGWRIRPRAYW
jgi:membrane associated rhomboid family serine protease